MPPSLQHVFYTDMGWQSRAWTDKLTHPAKARGWGVFRLETKKNPKMRGRAKKEGLGPAGDRDSARRLRIHDLEFEEALSPLNQRHPPAQLLAVGGLITPQIVP